MEGKKRERPKTGISSGYSCKRQLNYFYKYINNKRKVKEVLGALLDSWRNRVTKDNEKAEILKEPSLLL